MEPFQAATLVALATQKSARQSSQNMQLMLDSLASQVKGEKGNRGEKGERGDRGRDGRIGLRGQRGDKGDPGDQGDRGPVGELPPEIAAQLANIKAQLKALPSIDLAPILDAIAALSAMVQKPKPVTFEVVRDPVTSLIVEIRTK